MGIKQIILFNFVRIQIGQHVIWHWTVLNYSLAPVMYTEQRQIDPVICNEQR